MQIRTVPPGVPEGDTVIDMKAKVWVGELEAGWPQPKSEANQSTVKTSGTPALKLDLVGFLDPDVSVPKGIRFDDLIVRKIYALRDRKSTRLNSSHYS